jgi:hypothetical protein
MVSSSHMYSFWVDSQYLFHYLSHHAREDQDILEGSHAILTTGLNDNAGTSRQISSELLQVKRVNKVRVVDCGISIELEFCKVLLEQTFSLSMLGRIHSLRVFGRRECLLRWCLSRLMQPFVL